MAHKLCFAKIKTDDSEIHIHRHHFTAFMHQQHGTYLALPFLNKQHFFPVEYGIKKQTWQRRKGSYIFHHFDAGIDLPHKSLIPLLLPPLCCPSSFSPTLLSACHFCRRWPVL